MAIDETRPSGAADARMDRSSPTSKSQGASAPLIKDEEVDAVVQHLATIAEKSIGTATLGPLAPLAPTVVAVVGRYAKREPLRALLLAMGVAALYFAQRRWRNTPSPHLVAGAMTP